MYSEPAEKKSKMKSVFPQAYVNFGLQQAICKLFDIFCSILCSYIGDENQFLIRKASVKSTVNLFHSLYGFSYEVMSLSELLPHL